MRHRGDSVVGDPGDEHPPAMMAWPDTWVQVLSDSAITGVSIGNAIVWLTFAVLIGPSLSMSQPPETRASLLIRIRDAADQEAWHEFVEIYRPVIYRLGRRQGLQDADAEDLSQQVLVKIGQAIERWQPDRRRGQFRTWLYRVAHNAILNALSRGPRDKPAAMADPGWLFEQKPTPEGPDSDLLRLEFRREVFHWAARQIRPEFKQGTWDAFWLTAVEEIPIDAACERLSKSPGAIYAARSRVMRRLNEKIQEFESFHDAKSS